MVEIEKEQRLKAPWEKLEELLQLFYGKQGKTVGAECVAVDDAAVHSLAPPDESTILAFRRLLEGKNPAETIFKKVNQHLEEKGVLTRQGAVVDATVVQAPRSTKN